MDVNEISAFLHEHVPKDFVLLYETADGNIRMLSNIKPDQSRNLICNLASDLEEKENKKGRLLHEDWH